MSESGVIDKTTMVFAPATDFILSAGCSDCLPSISHATTPIVPTQGGLVTDSAFGYTDSQVGQLATLAECIDHSVVQHLFTRPVTVSLLNRT